MAAKNCTLDERLEKASTMYSYGKLYHFMGRHNRASVSSSVLNIPRDFVFVEILNVTYDTSIPIFGCKVSKSLANVAR